jgi:putative heme-binding domain-containing protein
LIHDWIRQLPADSESAGDAAASRKNQLKQLCEADSSTEKAKLVDRLLSSTSGALMLMQAVDRHALPAPLEAVSIKRATKHSEVSVRDLFERYLPADERTKHLGSVVLPQQILSLTGDAARGKQVFFEIEGVSCKNCHRIGDSGTEVGPELNTIGKKLTREQLLENILEPSKQIDPKYVTYLAETVEGRLLTGLLVTKDESEVVLRDAQNNLVRIPADEIEHLFPQRQSLMPELLFRDMTAQQVADLLEYLSSLK